jgi:hypothetical protein
MRINNTCIFRPNNVSIGALKFENDFSYKRVSAILKQLLNLSDEATVQYSRVENESYLINDELLSMKMHPFVGAIHLAYSYHLPLVITPDVIWHLISSGTSLYVNQNAEAVRKVFVDFEGKRTISLRRDQFVLNSTENKWGELIDEFSLNLNEIVKGDMLAVITSNFSTTTRESNLVSKIVLMESMQSYLEYAFYSLCNIPEYRLVGVREDWVSIQTRIRQLNRTLSGLSVWYNQLDTIIQNFIDVYDDRVNATFWDQIYKGNKVKTH